MCVEGEIFVIYYSKIPSTFYWASFDTKSTIENIREVFALLLFIPDKEEISFIWVQFQFNRRNHDWTEAKHDCKPFYVTIESPDAKETYSRLSSP